MSATSFCEQCGQPLAVGVRFCEHCGRPVAPGVVPPTQLMAAAAPAKSSMAGVLAFAAVGVVAVAAIVTFGVVRALRPKTPETKVTDAQTTATTATTSTKPVSDPIPPPPPVDGAKVVSSPPQGDPSAGSASPTSETTGTALDEARTYLPQPGFKYSYYLNYPDGDAGPESETVGRPSNKVLVSVVRAVPGDGETIYFSEHFAQGPEGVVRAFDDSPDGTELFLPDKLEVGKSWVQPGVQIIVKAMNQFVDLGFVKFHDAMVVSYSFEAEYEEDVYFVPGYGEVLAKTPGGLVAKKLTNVAAMGDAELAAVMAKHAPNAAKVN